MGKIVIGVDPAMRSLAMVSEHQSKKALIRPKKMDRYGELKQLQNELIMFRNAENVMTPMDEPGEFWHEVHMFIESPIQGRSKNVQTTVKLAMTVGAAYTICDTCTMVAPSTWKMALLGKGHGHAGKEEVKLWLAESHPDYSVRCDGDQDLVDATCIYLYGREALGLS